MPIKKFILFFVTISVVVTAGFLLRSQIDASERRVIRKALEGSWSVRITPNSPTPPFDEFMTFDAGGGIVESNNFPFFALGLAAGPGHGVYEYDEHGPFRFTFTKFLFTPQGQPAGTLRVTGTIAYSSSTDTWTSPGLVEIFDPAGNIILTDTTNGSATRIKIED